MPTLPSSDVPHDDPSSDAGMDDAGSDGDGATSAEASATSSPGPSFSAANESASNESAARASAAEPSETKSGAHESDVDGSDADEPSVPLTSAVEAVDEWMRLHPLTLLLRMLASLPALVFLMLPVLTDPSSENYLSLFLSILFGVLAFPAIVMKYLRFSYGITPKQIVIQRGVLKRQNRSIPIERVQNVQIEQNVVARFAGIAKVKIETAGSASTEGTLEYVGLQQANAIRKTVRSFQRQQRGRVRSETASTRGDAAQGNGASDEASHAFSDDAADDAAREPEVHQNAETLFTMDLGQTLLSGSFRFSLVYIVIVFSALQFVEPDTLVNWFLRERGRVEEFVAQIYAHPALALLNTVLLAFLLGWISGVALHLNRYYGFTLWLEDDKLRKRHGLLTVTEGTIPLSKVQALILKTNPVMRMFDWYELEVQTVGLNVEDQGHRVVIPFAKYDEILHLAQHIRPFEMPQAFESVSPLTIRRKFVRYSVALTAAVLVGVYFWPWDWWHPMGAALPWWGFALTPLLAGWAYLEYLQHGYTVRDDGFYIERGVLSHYKWVLPTEKFHVFHTTASVFQRRLGLRSLFVDTAGAAAFAYPEVIDLPSGIAHDALAHLHNQFHTLYARRVAATDASGDGLSEDERPRLPNRTRTTSSAPDFSASDSPAPDRSFSDPPFSEASNPNGPLADTASPRQTPPDAPSSKAASMDTPIDASSPEDGSSAEANDDEGSG